MVFHKKIIVAAGAAALTAGFYSSAVSAATVTANATANVITPLSIAETTGGMNFGDVSVDALVAGTVILDTTGARTVTAGAEAVTGGTVQSGAYSVTGEGTKAYSITFPANATISSGLNSMTVDTFTHDAGGAPALTAGSDTFNVGATLNIGAGQAPGNYTGSYTLTVDYQ